MLIYMAINRINGKRYIGKTTENYLSSRIAKHDCTARYKRSGNNHFHNALRKYGRSGFDWIIVDACDSEEMLSQLETHYIQLYDTVLNGYNSSYGGEGHTLTEETKKKISEANKGQKRGPLSKEHKQKLSDILRGRKQPPMTEEHKRKISVALKGRTLSDDTKRKIIETRKANGKMKLSEITKKRIGDANRGKVSWFKGRTMSEEQKRKIAKSNTKDISVEKRTMVQTLTNLQYSCNRISKLTGLSRYIVTRLTTEMNTLKELTERANEIHKQNPKLADHVVIDGEEYDKV